jgi:hypothetical protein
MKQGLSSYGSVELVWKHDGNIGDNTTDTRIFSPLAIRDYVSLSVAIGIYSSA